MQREISERQWARLLSNDPFFKSVSISFIDMRNLFGTVNLFKIIDAKECLHRSMGYNAHYTQIINKETCNFFLLICEYQLIFS